MACKHNLNDHFKAVQKTCFTKVAPDDYVCNVDLHFKKAHLEAFKTSQKNSVDAEAVRDVAASKTAYQAELDEVTTALNA